MKINFSSWAVNIIGALAFSGMAILAVNSPALPKNSTAYLIVLGAVMFFVGLANALKASVLPSANAKAVLEHAESTPPVSIKDATAVKAAKDQVK